MKRNELKEISKKHTTGKLMMRLYENYVGFPLHWHDEYEIIKIVSGKGRFVINGRYYEVGGSDVLFVNAGELHSLISHADPFVSYSVVIHPYLVFGNDCTQLLDRKRVFPRKTDDPEIMRELDRIYDADKRRDIGFELEIKASIIRIFSILYKCDDPVCEAPDTAEMIRLENIFDYVHTNYDKKMTLDTLCRVSNYSKSYIIRIFKRYTGKTPIEYINDYRIVMAQDMLNNSSESVIDIAMACGFGDVNYFIRTFRRSVGETPLQYRLSHK